MERGYFLHLLFHWMPCWMNRFLKLLYALVSLPTSRRHCFLPLLESSRSYYRLPSWREVSCLDTSYIVTVRVAHIHVTVFPPVHNPAAFGLMILHRETKSVYFKFAFDSVTTAYFPLDCFCVCLGFNLNHDRFYARLFTRDSYFCWTIPRTPLDQTIRDCATDIWHLRKTTPSTYRSLSLGFKGPAVSSSDLVWMGDSASFTLAALQLRTCTTILSERTNWEA